MKKLLALDGNNLLFRAYYALPPMQTADGRPTNAVYGFMGMLIRLMADTRPDAVAVAFDLHGPTFRHAQFAEYKAGRKPTPEDLIPQFDLLKELLRGIGVSVLEAQTFEADDILGTLSAQAETSGIQALLVSGDRDVFQLIGENTQVLYANRGVTDIDALDAARLEQRFGYAPNRVTDLKALMGDSSDNIPGIPGVGEKTAMNILSHFATLEDALARPEELLKGAMLKKVQAGGDIARLSRDLATIRRDAPITLDMDALRAPDLHNPKVYTALEALNMPSLSQRLRRAETPSAPTQQGPAAERKRWQPLKLLRNQAEAQAFLSDFPQGPIALTLWPEIEIACGNKQARICLKLDLLSDGFDEEEAYALLARMLEGREALYYDHKGARAHLLSRGIQAPPALDDALIGGYLLYGMDDNRSLAPLSESVFGTAGEGAALLSELCGEMRLRLKADGMEPLYRDIEMPLSDVLFAMEREGFALDAEVLRALGAGYDAQMNGIRESVYNAAGKEFNILSPKQLGDVLFVDLGLPPQRKTKRGYSTDSGVLEALDHPIAQHVLDYRALAKLKSTYVDGLLAVVTPDGRVHTTFHQTLTSTGRISSAEPNLQNIPVRTAQGREIRKAFVPREGNVLVDADYSQIELRVLAHMSGDPNMQEAYHLGQDIHRRTAAEIYGVSIEDVTSQMRSAAKAVNFGVVYGISDFGLARNTGISRAEARHFIDTYFERYPLVRRFMDECVAKGKTEGYVATMFGRRRYLPELSSSNYNTRSFGERAAMNTPIQGTAADIIKLAMVRVARAMDQQGFAARLILQVHDELIIDAPQDEVEAIRALLKQEMESVTKLDVPLEADVHTGDNWETAK